MFFVNIVKFLKMPFDFWIMSSQIFHPFISGRCFHKCFSTQEYTCARVSFLINVVAGLQIKSTFFQKEVLTQVFSWQLSEIFNSKSLKKYCYMKQEVGDTLSVCVLNILPKVNSLPSLSAINLIKMEIRIIQRVACPHVGQSIMLGSL